MSEAVGVIQLAVRSCFGYAAVSKLAAFRSFEQGVAGFDMVGSWMVRPAATVVVVLESVAAFCLVTGQAVLWGAGVSAALLAGFAIVIVSAKRRGVAASCMCFGGDGGDSASPRTYLRLALLGAGVAVVLTDALGSGDSRPAFSWAVMVAAGCVAVGCATLPEVPEVLVVTMGKPRRRWRRPGGEEIEP